MFLYIGFIGAIAGIIGLLVSSDFQKFILNILSYYNFYSTLIILLLIFILYRQSKKHIIKIQHSRELLDEKDSQIEVKISNLEMSHKSELQHFLRRENAAKANIAKNISIYQRRCTSLYNQMTADKKIEMNIDQYANDIADLLGNMGQVMDIACGRSFSVHIKTWFSHSCIRALFRTPSALEKEAYKNGLRARTDDECFYIDNLYNSHQIRKFAKENYGTHVNSMYNEVINKNQVFLIKQNLPEETKKANFYSNSIDYKKYYSHIGIFNLRDPKHSSGVTKRGSQISLGLLIFDAQGEKFDPDVLESYGIFFAESLYPIIQLFLHHFQNSYLYKGTGAKNDCTSRLCIQQPR